MTIFDVIDLCEAGTPPDNLDEIKEKYTKIQEMEIEVDDYLFRKFFDSDSVELLDEKIEALEALVAGKSPGEVPHYYEILENYPDETPDENGIARKILWD